MERSSTGPVRPAGIGLVVIAAILRLGFEPIGQWVQVRQGDGAPIISAAGARASVQDAQTFGL